MKFWKINYYQIYFNLDGESFIVTSKNGNNTTYPEDSGKPKNNVFDYSLKRQQLPFDRPIPEGEYWITFEEMWENAWYKPGSTAAWENFRIAIHPYPNTEIYSRGGLFVHGGDVRGSADCIDLTQCMDRFVKQMKAELATKKCFIPLTVKY